MSSAFFTFTCLIASLIIHPVAPPSSWNQCTFHWKCSQSLYSIIKPINFDMGSSTKSPTFTNYLQCPAATGDSAVPLLKKGISK